MKETDATRLWAVLRAEAQVRVSDEPMLASLYHATVLRHASLEDALAGVLAVQLDTGMLPAGAARCDSRSTDVRSAYRRSDLCRPDRDTVPAIRRVIRWSRRFSLQGIPCAAGAAHSAVAVDP